MVDYFFISQLTGSVWPFNILALHQFQVEGRCRQAESDSQPDSLNLCILSTLKSQVHHQSELGHSQLEYGFRNNFRFVNIIFDRVSAVDGQSVGLNEELFRLPANCSIKITVSTGH